MKKVILLLCVVALCFTGCKKDETNPYVGKYKGTFTTVGENTTTKESTVRISAGIGTNLLLEYVIDMKKLDEGRYECDGSNSFTAAMLSTVLSLCGLNNEYFDGTVEKITVDARFSGDNLNMTIDYRTDLGVTITSTFKGSKVKE